MLKSDSSLAGVKVTTQTMPKEQVTRLLDTPGISHRGGHYQYPVDDGDMRGSHLDSIFVIEPIAAETEYINWIVADIKRWLESEKIEFEVIFAPAQPAVMRLVDQLSFETGKRAAYWEYKSTGWFGDKLVSGKIDKGDKVLVMNGVTQQGRCVGERLPSFVSKLGGETVAAAVIAKGTAAGVKEAEKKYGSKFYSTFQVSIEVATPSECKACDVGDTHIVPWTDLRDKK
jgi:orotate phosphoribosyltransferase